jgi:hypothetical protein
MFDVLDFEEHAIVFWPIKEWIYVQGETISGLYLSRQLGPSFQRICFELITVFMIPR